MSTTHDTAFANSGNAAVPRRRRLWLASRGAASTGPAPMSLAERVADAHIRVQHQGDEALYDAMSDAEIDAKIEAWRQLRERELDEEIRTRQVTLVAKEQAGERQRRIAAESAAIDDERRAHDTQQDRWRRSAEREAEKLTSDNAQLASMAKLLQRGRRALLWLIPSGMVWSAVNIQHNFVPDGDMSSPLYWVSYGVSALITGALILLMATSAATARVGRGPSSDGTWWQRHSVFVAEVSLVLVEVLLNTARPFVHGQTLLALEYAVPGLAVGLLVWVYNHMTDRLSRAIIAVRSRSTPTIVLDDGGLANLGYAQRAFAAMAEGLVPPSTAPDGGGVPAGGQLAKLLGLSKPNANQVRNEMKKLATGEVRIVVPMADQAKQPHMSLVASNVQ